MKQLIEAIRQNTHARIVLLTTTCVDTRKNAKLEGYNKTLAAFDDERRRSARARSAGDRSHTRSGAVGKGQKADPDFTLIPMPYHPNEARHMLMAFTVLKAGREDVTGRQVPVWRRFGGARRGIP